MKRTPAMLLIGVFLIAAAGIPVLRRDASRADRAPVLRSASLTTPVTQPTALEFRLAAVESTYWRGETDSARMIWRSLLEEPDVTADSARIAYIQTWIGMAGWRLSEYDEARRIGEASLALKLRHGYTNELPRSYNLLGLIAWNQGRLADALAHYTEGFAAARANADTVMLGKFASNIGLTEVEFARFAEARVKFEEAIRIGVQAGDARLEANALTNLAMLDIRVDDPAAAVPRLERARGLYQDIDYPAGHQIALGQLATAYAGLGDLQRAFTTLDSADVLAARHGLKRESAANLEFRGDLYRDAGDLQKALLHYQRAQVVNHELDLEIERGTVLRKAASVHLALGAKAAAFASARNAAAIHRAAGARLEELRDHLLLATGDAAHLAPARTLAREIATPGVLADLALAEARIAAESGAHAEVLRLLRADSLNIERAGFEADGEAAALRASAYAHSNQPMAAAAAVAHALNALESARMTLGSGMLRASFAANRAGLYARLIDVELRMGRPREALRIADLARARPGSRLLRDAPAGHADVALLRVRELTDKANLLAEAVADDDETSRPALAAVQDELKQARAEYESIIARSAWQPGTAGTASIDAIAAALLPDEVLLEYFVADGRVIAFALTRAGVRAERIAVPAAGLVARIGVARAALASPAGDASKALASLHDALVAPFMREIAGKRRLIVVPHGALTYLPFAALRDRSGRYLVEEHVVHYLPAASELPRLRHASPIANRPHVQVLQPFPKQLPGTTAEARTVKRAWRGRVLSGGRATTASMRNALDSNDVLHVSSHAAMDAQSPLFSYVSLAPHANDDGRFEVHDVFASRVRNPLVYLSGCETGLGGASSSGYETGADASTFAHAFLAAGARAVVSTVWRIEDRSAAVFAGQFYRQLRSHDAAEALTLAQRELLRSAAYRQPFYWAPYLLTGDVEFGNGRR